MLPSSSSSSLSSLSMEKGKSYFTGPVEIRTKPEAHFQTRWAAIRGGILRIQHRRYAVMHPEETIFLGVVSSIVRKHVRVFVHVNETKTVELRLPSAELAQEWFAALDYGKRLGSSDVKLDVGHLVTSPSKQESAVAVQMPANLFDETQETSTDNLPLQKLRAQSMHSLPTRDDQKTPRQKMLAMSKTKSTNTTLNGREESVKCFKHHDLSILEKEIAMFAHLLHRNHHHHTKCHQHEATLAKKDLVNEIIDKEVEANEANGSLTKKEEPKADESRRAKATTTQTDIEKATNKDFDPQTSPQTVHNFEKVWMLQTNAPHVEVSIEQQCLQDEKVGDQVAESSSVNSFENNESEQQLHEACLKMDIACTHEDIENQKVQPLGMTQEREGILRDLASQCAGNLEESHHRDGSITTKTQSSGVNNANPRPVRGRVIQRAAIHSSMESNEFVYTVKRLQEQLIGFDGFDLLPLNIKEMTLKAQEVSHSRNEVNTSTLSLAQDDIVEELVGNAINSAHDLLLSELQSEKAPLNLIENFAASPKVQTLTLPDDRREATKKSPGLMKTEWNQTTSKANHKINELSVADKSISSACIGSASENRQRKKLVIPTTLKRMVDVKNENMDLNASDTLIVNEVKERANKSKGPVRLRTHKSKKMSLTPAHQNMDADPQVTSFAAVDSLSTATSLENKLQGPFTQQIMQKMGGVREESKSSWMKADQRTARELQQNDAHDIQSTIRLAIESKFQATRQVETATNTVPTDRTRDLAKLTLKELHLQLLTVVQNKSASQEDKNQFGLLTREEGCAPKWMDTSSKYQQLREDWKGLVIGQTKQQLRDNERQRHYSRNDRNRKRDLIHAEDESNFQLSSTRSNECKCRSPKCTSPRQLRGYCRFHFDRIKL